MLLVISPRTAPGLLTWPAWEALREADQVFAADLDPEWEATLAEAGVRARDLSSTGTGAEGAVGVEGAGADPIAPDPVAVRAGRLLTATEGGRDVVWFGSADGDPGLTDALAEHLARRAIAAAPPAIELITGSHDVPGARLLDLVAVMDRLRSPGGCPWDAEQTHHSLAPYALEEAREVVEVIEAADDDAGIDREDLVEELGDLLLQVAFHARVAQEHPDAPFGIDEVAAGIVAKLVRRHPHVFADVRADTPEQVSANWDQIKAAEKAEKAVRKAARRSPS